MLAYFCCQNGNAIAEPTEEGLRRLGYTVQRVIPWAWNDVMFVKGTTLVVATGLRKQQAKMVQAHAAKGIPWIAFDLPHIRSKVGDSRLFAVDHTWLPNIDGLPSRLERLGLTLPTATVPVVAEPEAPAKPVKKKRTTKKASTKAKAAKAEAAPPQGDGYALVVGQVPRDSSHGLSEGQLEHWASGACEEIRRALPDVEIVWRPHPKAGRAWNYYPKGFDTQQEPLKIPAAEAIAGARVVCVYGSTVGIEALIAGKPVVSWGPSCYQSLAHPPEDLATAQPADPEALRSLLERVAYTQWGLEELATGEPFRFLFQQVGIPCTVTYNYS